MPPFLAPLRDAPALRKLCVEISLAPLQKSAIDDQPNFPGIFLPLPFMKYFFIFSTLITFLTFGLDKRRVEKHQRRIPESVLLFLTFLGGTAGAILGMISYRHKTSKKSFLFKIALVILLQGLIIYALLYHF
ncbi:DUF1294 domain-containing protein [uncultured Chryseobacterium sp.]|uniref:DUF1294 domain-containing protein n=1 Tax=uncultured Chryseobacterium sp. TaxID=259322 RepID=UPI0025E9E969|nr:DUF1294 domain-containing protein [uncultured Chryseobacterium sp.]